MNKRYNPVAKQTSAPATSTATAVEDAPARIIPLPKNTPPAVTRALGVKKIAFGNLTQKKESTKTAYPILPDPSGEIYQLAKLIKEKSTELEALEGAVEGYKAQLKALTLRPYFDLHTGKGDVPSSVSIPTTVGEVLVTFSGRYKKTEDDGPLVELLGEEFAGAHFKQAFTITIDGEKLRATDPSDPERSPAQEFVDALQALVAEHNAGDAVTFKQQIKPTKEFHEQRHQLLTPEMNVRVDGYCPMVVMVKTKGREE